jgi:carbonic anhydrase
MKKIFHFDSHPQPYVTDAAVLCCFDQRIRLAVNKFLQRQGILRPDMIVVAGGAKTLASPRNDFERDFILEQVRMSIRLHQASQLFLMTHSDCATYGGLQAFGGDTSREMDHHRGELRRSAEQVKQHFPELILKRFFVDFSGVHSANESEVEEVA